MRWQTTRLQPFPALRRLQQPHALAVGEGNAPHQRVPVQADAGSIPDVVGPDVLLQLLVGLLADPARLADEPDVLA